MWSGSFWIRAGERAVKTFAQALAAGVGSNSVGITALDWPQLLSVAATAAVLSVLTSVGSLPLGPGDSPSLVE